MTCLLKADCWLAATVEYGELDSQFFYGAIIFAARRPRGGLRAWFSTCCDHKHLGL